jgi:hypothetical protein
MIAAAFAFVLVNIRLLLLVGSGWLSMYGVWYVVDIFDDRAVARAARADYVRISELEAERARAHTMEQLLAAERLKTAENEALLAAYAQAVETTLDAVRKANAEQIEGMQDEIDDLINARPDVPSVRDLGVKLRN